MYWNSHRNSDIKYTIAVQRNGVILYVPIGKDVWDLWTDMERKKKREGGREGGRKKEKESKFSKDKKMFK